MQKENVILIEKEEWKNYQDLIMRKVNSKKQPIRILSEGAEGFEELAENYDLYEYTDKVAILREHPAYSSMKNYVEQGIISEEEMIEALLYKFE